MQSKHLAEWLFKEYVEESDITAHLDLDAWTKGAAPGTVMDGLLAAGKIADPFLEMNEIDVQWIGEKDWIYRTEFEKPALENDEKVVLAFDGLDTIAKVYLNGQFVLGSKNMFVGHRLDISGKLQEGMNQIAIVFESALMYGRKEEQAHGGPLPLWNGDSSRLFVRKAGYHYGWDWGPVLMTTGPWKEVRLEVGEARIADVWPSVSLSENNTSATVKLELELENSEGTGCTVSLISPSGGVVAEKSFSGAGSRHKVQFSLDNPELWWPNGYGEAALYTVDVRLSRELVEVDRSSKKVGIRKFRLVEDALDDGSTFYFEVNGRPIFAGGANWIPDDNLLPRISRERYFERVAQAKAANMVMLRVWGGGIYESEDFYDACDEMGIMVWQDFMFACGIYPNHPDFLESVREEAKHQVRRLRGRTSLAHWCGNNEDYEIAFGTKRYRADLSPEENIEFPARMIYERLIPEVLSELDPGRSYKPGSSYNGDNPKDSSKGDRHSWEIWHVFALPYQEYKNWGGRFSSEFGVGSAPSMQLLKQSISSDELAITSRTFEHHDKAGGGPRRMAIYIAENLSFPVDLEGYVYATQFVQAEAMRYSYGPWRRAFGKKLVGGALVWQINDCWPVSSWAIIDSAGITKPAYHAIQRELEPVVLGFWREAGQLEGWVVNTKELFGAELELKYFSLEGELLRTRTEKFEIGADTVTELGALETGLEEEIVSAKVIVDGEILAERVSWPEPYKYLRIPQPNLSVRRVGDQIEISSDKPVKGVWLEANNATWTENFFDLVPGEVKISECLGVTGRPVKISFLGDRGSVSSVLVN